ncbi:MAG: PHP domain-containing protein, partial [Christensenella sp.]
YDAVEIYNYSTEWIENMGESSIFWEELLSRGKCLWGGGSDDNHNRYEMDSLYCDSFGGFTVVKAKNKTDKAIFEALKTGSFYTSTGPEIYDFYVEDDTVHVKCSPCKRIFINGNARQYQRVLGKYITEFTAKLNGSEMFIRAECMDEAGRTAYTNPIFLNR